MSKFETVEVRNANLEEFVREVVRLTNEGWEIDPVNPPSQLAWLYETQMFRAVKETDPAKIAKRAEILEKARAAKAAKAATQEQETPQE